MTTTVKLICGKSKTNPADFQQFGQLIYNGGVYDVNHLNGTVSSGNIVVSSGEIYVPNRDYDDGSNTNRVWVVRLYGDETIQPPSANTSSNPRFDAIVVKVNKSVNPDEWATNVATIEAVQGDASLGRPYTDTELNALIPNTHDYIRIGNARIDAGASSYDSYQDTRVFITRTPGGAGVGWGAQKNWLMNSTFAHTRFGWSSNDWNAISYDPGRSSVSITGDTSSTKTLSYIKLYKDDDETGIVSGDEMIFSGIIQNTTGGGAQNKVGLLFRWYDSSSATWITYDTKWLVLDGDTGTDIRFFTYPTTIPNSPGHGEFVFYVYANSNPATYKISYMKLEHGHFPTLYIPRAVISKYVALHEIFRHNRDVTVTTTTDYNISALSGGSKRSVGIYLSAFAGDNDGVNTAIRLYQKQNGVYSSSTAAWVDAKGKASGKYSNVNTLFFVESDYKFRAVYKAADGIIILRYYGFLEYE